MFKGPRKAGGAEEAAGRPAAAQRGEAAEAWAARWLQQQGLTLVETHYRVARGPSARGGEIDLVMRDADGTLVFVEVRARQRDAQGGAAASVTRAKQRRVVYAAQHYLLRFAAPPPCRFDVLALDGEDGASVSWLRGAFDAG